MKTLLQTKMKLDLLGPEHRASCTTSTAATTAVNSVGEVVPLGFAKRTEFRGTRIEADMASLMSRLACLR